MIQIRATAITPEDKNVEIVLTELDGILGLSAPAINSVVNGWKPWFRQLFAVDPDSERVVHIYKDNIGSLVVRGKRGEG